LFTTIRKHVTPHISIENKTATHVAMPLPLDQATLLPTITEINSSSIYLSKKDAWSPYRIKRVRDNLVVKFGKDSELLVEAETMEFLHSHIPACIPGIFGIIVEDCPRKRDLTAKCYYLVMEYIPGTSYLEVYPSLTPVEKRDIQQQFRSIMDELRGLPSPGYYGRVGRRPLYDLTFQHPHMVDADICGPFATEEDFNRAIAILMDRPSTPFHPNIFDRCITDVFCGYRLVFSHGDLQDRNLIISQVGEHGDGHRLFKVTLIDWQFSGWYPDYWEFRFTACTNNGGHEWQELLQAGLDLYSKEFPLMFLIRQTIRDTY
jgi:hypothetical protein